MNFNDNGPLRDDPTLLPENGTFWNELEFPDDQSQIAMSHTEPTGDTASLYLINSHGSESFASPPDTTDNPRFEHTPWWDDDNLSITGEKRDFDAHLSGSEDDYDKLAPPSSVKKQKTHKPGFSPADLDFREILDGLNKTYDKLKAAGQSTDSTLDFTEHEEQLTLLSDLIGRTQTKYKPQSEADETETKPIVLDAKDGRGCTTCKTNKRTCMSSKQYLERWDEVKGDDGAITYVLASDKSTAHRAPACATCRTRKAKCQIKLPEGIAGTELTQSSTA